MVANDEDEAELLWSKLLHDEVLVLNSKGFYSLIPVQQFEEREVALTALPLSFPFPLLFSALRVILEQDQIFVGFLDAVH